MISFIKLLLRVLFRSNLDIAMSSNRKFTLYGDPNSKKQRGVGADSFPGTNKSIDKHGGSSVLLIGDPYSKISKGDASVSSPGLKKPIGATGDSSGVPTGVSNLKKPNGKRTRVFRYLIIISEAL